MSVFGNMMSKIFGHANAHAAPAAPQQPSSAAAGQAKTSGPTSVGSTPSGASTAKTAAAPATGQVQVDVEAVLKDLASKNKEKFDWRNSIVDLMKLVDLDSSLSARKELAKELNYTGDMNDSAKMNIWLHKQVMIKLAENGGKVPDSLKT
jgi:Domain of unknown function (DUF3597)